LLPHRWVVSLLYPKNKFKFLVEELF
jgi:hypothetical protein